MPAAAEAGSRKFLPVSDAQIQLARHCLLFRGVDEPTLARLPDTCDLIRLQPGEVLMSLGEVNDYLYLILDGELKVQTGQGAHHHYLVLQAGECAGELSMVDSKEVSAIVSAVTDSQLLRIGREALWSLIEGCHTIARNLFYILSLRLRESNKAINDALEQRAYFEKAAYLDSLTGINNRRWLDKAFTRELERCRKNGEPLSLAFVDIDHFKQFNDRHGHLAGDIALRAVAQAMVRTLRPTDLLARYGGEEFAVLFPGADGAIIVDIAERLRRIIGQLKLKNYDGTELPRISLSVGLATRQAEESVEHFMGRADQALYRAKAQGRNRVVSAEAGCVAD